jgi:predicted transcriptional regulator
MEGMNSKTAMEVNQGIHGSCFQPFSKLGLEIYKIAQHIMDKHYCINLSDLATACVRFIKGANKIDILNEIHRLEKERIFLDGHALTNSEVLKNPVRKEIRDIISSSPGVNFSRLRDTTGKGNHLLAWHLSVLEKFTYIRSATIDGSLAYFAKDAPPDQDVLNALSHKPGLKEMLILVLKLGEMKSKEIELALKLPHATAFRRLRKLVEHGFLQEQVYVEHDAMRYKVNLAWIEPIRKLRE